VAAGLPVSARTTTTRGHDLATNQADCGAGETPERLKPWTWQRDAISPQNRGWRKPSRGCENLRTEQSGSLGRPAIVDAIGDAAKRDKPEQDGGSERSSKENGRRNSEGEMRHEGMNSIRKSRGTVDSVKRRVRWKQLFTTYCE